MPETNLNELFENGPENKVIGASNIRPPRAGHFNIYPLSKFKELQEAVKSISVAQKNCFRYLVDTSGKLWLAAEGSANSTVPAHFQLTGMPRIQARCLTAGNLKFDKNRLILINHKSGDFQPSFSSLSHLLMILANTENLPFEMNDFSIEQLTSSGGFVKHFETNADDLLVWGSQYSDKVSPQPEEIKTVEYQGPKSQFSRFQEENNDSAAAATSPGSSLFSSPRMLGLFAENSDSESFNHSESKPISSPLKRQLLFQNEEPLASIDNTDNTASPSRERNRLFSASTQNLSASASPSPLKRQRPDGNSSDTKDNEAPSAIKNLFQ